MKAAGSVMGRNIYLKYRHFLGRDDGLDLGQGLTPVVRSRSIGPRAGIADLRFKLEQLNPTGSYKDRFAGLAVGGAAAEGADRCIATSSGNTGAALAAFCASAGLKCILFVSELAPAGKLGQMQAYGAKVFRVKGMSIDADESLRAMNALEEATKRLGLPLHTSAYAKSPLDMDGIKTIAYELAEDVPEVTDVFAPVGGAGLHVAISRGFADLETSGGRASPRMHVVQPAGNDTVATPLREGATAARDVSTTTSISGLGVGHVLDGTLAIGHARRTGGMGFVADEDFIRKVQRRLAEEEGIFVEPAGATSVAGALMAAEEGRLAAGTTVCILTGHGFKDPPSVAVMADRHASIEIGASDISGILGA
jgi:threonine synthase